MAPAGDSVRIMTRKESAIGTMVDFHRTARIRRREALQCLGPASRPGQLFSDPFLIYRHISLVQTHEEKATRLDLPRDQLWICCSYRAVPHVCPVGNESPKDRVRKVVLFLEVALKLT